MHNMLYRQHPPQTTRNGGEPPPPPPPPPQQPQPQQQGQQNTSIDPVLARCGASSLRFHHSIIQDPYQHRLPTDSNNGGGGGGGGAPPPRHCAHMQQQQQHCSTVPEQTIIGFYPAHVQQKYAYDPHGNNHQHHHHHHQHHGQPQQQQQQQHMLIHDGSNTWLRVSQQQQQQQPYPAAAYYTQTSLPSKSTLIFPAERISADPLTITPPPTARIDRTSRGDNTNQISSTNDDFDWFMAHCTNNEMTNNTTSNEQQQQQQLDTSGDFESYYHHHAAAAAAAGLRMQQATNNSILVNDISTQPQTELLISSNSPPGGTKRPADNGTSADMTDDDSVDDEQDCLRLKMMIDPQQVDLNSPPTLSAGSTQNSQDFSTTPVEARLKCKTMDEAAAGNRSRSSETYFWQYNVQAKGPKTKRTLHLKNKDPHVPRSFFDPVCQMKAKMTVGRGGSSSGASPKLRKGDGNDVTPNPQKLLLLGMQIKQLTEASYRLTPTGSEHKESLKREKNKLASRSCRLKKKAQHEANKLKLEGLNEEHSILLSVINKLRGIIYNYLICKNQQKSNRKLTALFNEIVSTNYRLHVAGSTDGYVSAVLDSVPRPSANQIADFNLMEQHQQCGF